MATIRVHTHVDAPVQQVWDAVRDPIGLVEWMPGIDGGEMVTDTARKLTMGSISVVEDVVTIDDDLNRFQYTITEMPVPIESHLTTIDVLPDGDGSLLIIGVDVKPDELAGMIKPAMEGALAGIKNHVEST
jgi:carbon monoxide dehydrogenase subunit G